MASGHGFGYAGRAGHEQTEEPPRGGCLAEIARLGEHHDVAAVADTLEVLQGYGVADASVEHAPSVIHTYGTCDHRHGGRGPEPFERVVADTVHDVVDGVAGVDIGTHYVKLRGIFFEGLRVKDVKFEREGVVGKFSSDKIAACQERAQPHVAGVVVKAHVVAQHASRLP